MELRAKLVEQGLGMSYLDAKLIEQRTTKGHLTGLDSLTFASLPMTFGLFYRKKKQLSTGAKRFIEMCENFKF